MGNEILTKIGENTDNIAGPYKQLITDETGKAKWEDRLAYEIEPVITEVMSEQTVEFTSGAGAGFRQATLQYIDLVDGFTYIVKFDGNTYECICNLFNDFPYIGNIGILGLEETGEPFVISNSDGVTICASNDVNATHTISVSASLPKVVQMSAKYIPYLKVVIVGNDADGYTSNCTAGEIRSAYLNDIRIQGIYFNGNDDSLLHLRKPSKRGFDLSYYPIVFYELASSDDLHWRAPGSVYYKEYIIDDRGVTVKKQNRCLVLESSTTDSTKQFKITVDDSGTISATELTN